MTSLFIACCLAATAPVLDVEKNKTTLTPIGAVLVVAGGAVAVGGLTLGLSDQARVADVSAPGDDRAFAASRAPVGFITAAVGAVVLAVGTALIVVDDL